MKLVPLYILLIPRGDHSATTSRVTLAALAGSRPLGIIECTAINTRLIHISIVKN